jgi:hypothetical protein
MLQYSHILDTSGTVAIAQSIERMRYPWSMNVMANAPFGEDFWSLSRMVQAVQWLVLWILTRFGSAILAVNLLICIGWVLSGIAAFALSKYLKYSTIAAVFSGLLVQMLPWVREKAMTHVSYVYLCVPIFAILLLFQFKDIPKKENFIKLFSFFCLTAFFDLYWFYINILIAAVFIVVSYESLFQKFQIVAVAVGRMHPNESFLSGRSVPSLHFSKFFHAQGCCLDARIVLLHVCEVRLRA